MIYKQFPFGKYKGYLLEDIPVNYLVYAISEFSLPEDLEEQMKDLLIKNLNLDKVDTYSNRNVKNVFGIMCKKYDPELIGSNKELNAVIDFYKHLIED